MIASAVKLIVQELQEYIPAPGAAEVVEGNIAFNESADAPSLSEKLVVSLVNVEEESTLKNGNSFRRSLTGAGYREHPVHLNLYLLFSSNFDSYDKSLKRLGEVIQFFQHRKSFSYSSATVTPADSTEDDASIYLTAEMYTLTFEQINHLWGSLGGKQMPFVMFKLRLVTIEEKAGTGPAPLIEEIQNITLTNADDC